MTSTSHCETGDRTDRRRQPDHGRHRGDATDEPRELAARAHASENHDTTWRRRARCVDAVVLPCLTRNVRRAARDRKGASPEWSPAQPDTVSSQARPNCFKHGHHIETCRGEASVSIRALLAKESTEKLAGEPSTENTRHSPAIDLVRQEEPRKGAPCLSYLAVTC